MTKKSSRLAGKIVLFALIFGVPWGLLLFLNSQDHTFKPLRYLGPTEITQDGDTSHFVIPDFEFEKYGGGELNKEDLLGKYTIAMVVSNECPDHCAIQLYQFWELIYQELTSTDSYDDAQIISEVVDYRTNSPDEPLAVLEYLDVDTSRWKFYWTDHNVLFDFEAREGYPKPIDVEGPAEFGGKKYYELALLIDKKGHVRGIYRLDHSAWIMELRNGLRLLIKQDVLTMEKEES